MSTGFQGATERLGEKKGGRRWLSLGSAISETITILGAVGGGRGFRFEALTAHWRDRDSFAVERLRKKDGYRPRSWRARNASFQH